MLVCTSCDQFGNTPLHSAANFGHVEVVKQLAAAGADPTAYNVVSLANADHVRFVKEGLQREYP